MGHHATITSKGQMTVPKAVREALNIKPGDKCYVWVRDGEMIVIPRNKCLADLAGILGEPPYGTGATIDDLSKAAMDGAADHVMRSIRQADPD
ncbi:AbrB/MazE/SpoVT family DNA-binding domain-containing protein [Rhizobium herbae]|uniref:AbrB/MazE/SpoVT family DNA-binding domain-containing protein n=1 Tax=Rhizobium herbae TaxID=508661 RepID=A0ABS7HDB0_9HYPH|nr:AbrB/MazE/SpoVT family DNA-binding domain-containing protein [Rhizobium herbae]MBW9065262.1 AbrB/MazE/SpoVT family DNA-binding domain-containing protein [Rhizobium herbae]